MIRPIDLSVLRLGRREQGELPAVGKRVEVKVLRLLSNNRVSLRLAGKVLTARTTVPLRPGQSLAAEVARWGNTTVLRLDPPSIRGSLLEQARLPDSPTNRSLIDAMVRAGLPLDPHHLRRLRTLLDGMRRQDDQAIRLLIEAHRKGIELPSDAVDALTDLSDRDTSSKNRQKRPKREVPEESDKTESLLPATALQLFNHIGSDEDHWIVVPLKFDDRTNWTGSARIRFDKNGRWQDAAIRFDTPENSHWALISSSGRSVTLLSDQSMSTVEGPVSDALQKLTEALEGLSFTSLSIRGSSPNFDGFSTRYSPDIIRSVDEEA